MNLKAADQNTLGTSTQGIETGHRRIAHLSVSGGPEWTLSRLRRVVSNSTAACRLRLCRATVLSVALVSTSAALATGEVGNGWQRPASASVSPRPLTASDLVAGYGAYIGKTVRLRSTVSRSFGRHAFVVNDEPLLAAPDVLVLVPYSRAPAPDNYMLMLVGTVRTFDPRELQREYAWFGPQLFKGTELWAYWQKDGVSVIVAESVQNEVGLELADTSAAGPSSVGTWASGTSEKGGGSETDRTVMNLGTIYERGSAAALRGDPVVLNAIRVQRVLDPEFITVGLDPQHPVVVRLPQPDPTLAAGEIVAVSGVLQMLRKPLQQWGLNQPAVLINASRVEILSR